MKLEQMVNVEQRPAAPVTSGSGRATSAASDASAASPDFSQLLVLLMGIGTPAPLPQRVEPEPAAGSAGEERAENEAPIGPASVPTVIEIAGLVCGDARPEAVSPTAHVTTDRARPSEAPRLDPRPALDGAAPSQVAPAAVMPWIAGPPRAAAAPTGSSSAGAEEADRRVSPAPAASNVRLPIAVPVASSSATIDAAAARAATENEPAPARHDVDARGRMATPDGAGPVVGTPAETVSRLAATLNGAAVASAPAPPAPTAPAAGRPVTPPRGAQASAEGALAGATTAPATEPATVGHQAAAHGPIAWSQADPDPGAGDRHQTPRHDVGDRLQPISPVVDTFTVQQADASADVQAPRPVAAPPLGEQVVQAARLVVTDGLSQMDVRLDPPELGGIRVTATAGPDGIGLTITADRVETHALLVHALPEIQTLLAERGVPAAAVAVAATSDPPAERRAPNRREPDRGSRGSQTPTDSRRPLAPRRAVGTVDLTV